MHTAIAVKTKLWSIVHRSGETAGYTALATQNLNLPYRLLLRLGHISIILIGGNITGMSDNDAQMHR